MNILFEDKYIIVVVKPVGILSQSDMNGGENMISILEEHSNTAIYPLHRLDKEVGGVMVYAKNKTSAAILSRDISEHNFKKQYLALVHGAPETPEGEMRDLLFKDSRKNKTFIVQRQRKGVKEAVLDYKTINTVKEDDGDLTVVKVLLHTGRTHQIRVQFASRKMPLVGDKKYGARDSFGGIGLWSYFIGFTHPKTHESLEFMCEPENIIGEYIK